MSIWNLDLATRRNLETNTMKQTTDGIAFLRNKRSLAFNGNLRRSLLISIFYEYIAKRGR